MTVAQREAIQNAVQALIDVEAALKEGESTSSGSAHLERVQRILAEARQVLADLNAPEYN